MKKLFIIIFLLLPQLTFAAPTTTRSTTLLPLSDNAYDLGTTTNRWRNLYLSGSVSAPIALTLSGFTQGSALFVGPSGSIAQDNTNFFWDDTNNRLGVGIAVPTEKLHIDGGYLNFSGGDYGLKGTASLSYTAVSDHYFYTGVNNRLTIKGSTGHVGIGTSSPAAPLDIVDTLPTGVVAPHANTILSLTRNGTGYMEFITPNTSKPYILFSDNTFAPGSIYYDHATDSMGFGTNLVEDRIKITSAGNVGIGTTTPGQKLEVRSTVGSYGLLVGGTDSLRAVLIGANSTNVAAIQGYKPSDSSNQSLYIQPDGGNAILVNGGGSVGVGTTSPEFQFVVDGGTSGPDDNKAIILATNKDTSYGPEFRLKSFATNGRDWRIGSGQTGNTAGQGKFFIYDANAGADRLVIDSSGNVGMGTTTPQRKLELYAGSSGGFSNTGANFVIEDSTTNYLQFLNPSASTAGILFGDEADNGAGGMFYNHSTNLFDIRTNGTASADVVVNSSGNMGIGTTSPTSKLSVLDTAFLVSELSSSNSTGSFLRFTKTAGTSRSWDLGATGSAAGAGDNKFGLYDNNASAYRWVVDSSGNVGIGTTTPQALLAFPESTAVTDGIKFGNNANLYKVGNGYLRLSTPGVTDAGYFNINAAGSSFAAVYQAESTARWGLGRDAISSGVAGLTFGGSVAGSVLSNAGAGIGAGPASNSLSIYASNGSSPVENSRYTSSVAYFPSTGKVGIGTTTPWATLSVGTANLAITTPSFVIASSSTGVATTTQFVVVNGNVGIATTTPNFKLSVHGDVIISGGTFLGGTTTATTSENYLGRISPTRYLTMQTGTSTAWTGTTTGAYLVKIIAPFSGTIRNAQCATNNGTAHVDIYHTSSHLDYIAGVSSTAALTTFTTNTTFTTGEPIFMAAGTPAGLTPPTSVSCTLGITETP